MRQPSFVRSLLLSTSCLSLFAVSGAHGQPTGATVTAGQASIRNSGSNSTTITQTSDKALINWQSFSIAAGGTVQFNQPNSSSITLNRVIGASSSTIDGSLLANGQVWLINANGILFGKGSTINVAGLLATTSDIADSDFMAGNYNFNSGSDASIVNQGAIKTQSGGAAVLSAARVVNQGLIEADAGTVVLGGASAFTVDFDGDNLLRYAIAAPAGQAANGPTGVANSGTIMANGGRVVMTVRAAASVENSVVNNTGMIEATSAHVQNGEVVLDAGGGTVNAGGSIDASGTGRGETGGTVAITGATVNVADNTQINVSGDSGGGTVNIGGAAHGGPTLQAANNTTVGKATINADAITSGNGGSLVVWSNGITDFSAVFSATGGAAFGNGGNIETSGATLHIAPSAKVNTTAANGTSGNWLLDPLNIIIANGGGTALSGGTLGVATDPGLTDTIAPSTITSALATTNVTLEASNDITVTNGFSYASTFSLNLLAMHSITINDSIQNTLASGGGAINLVAGWDGTTLNPAQFGNSGVYGNNSGAFSIIGAASGVAIGSQSGATNLYTGNVTLDATNGYAQLGYHGAGGGDILVRGLGKLTITAGAGASDFAMIGNGSTIGDVVGNITGNIDIRAVGNSVLSGGSGSGNVPWIGDVATSPDSETGNVTFVTASISEKGGAFGQNVADDVVGGDVTIGITNPSQVDTINHPITYNSSHTVNVLTAGSFEIDAPLQNTGSGAIIFVTGWDGTTLDPAHFGDSGVFGNNGKGFLIGGSNATGDVAFGSAGGKTSVYAASVSIQALNGYAQFGYHGAGGGSIAIKTVGDVNLSANPFVAEIGNGGTDVAADTGGAITINAGGNVTIDEASVGAGPSLAVIGNLGGGASSSQSGDISVTAGGALTVQTEANVAFIGNTSVVPTTGGATGNITINAGSVTIENLGLGFRATIGDGAKRQNQGTTGGDISITSGTLDLLGSIDPAAVGQVRIGNFGAGSVVGNINIVTTGDITLVAPSGELASIGNSDNAAATTSGDISVQSGGAITLSGLGTGVARISAGFAPSSNITVTAASDITLLTAATGDASTGGQAFIGSFANGLDALNGNLTVTSTGGGINLLATEDMSFIRIGSQAATPSSGGTLTINAPKGTLSLVASGTGAQAAIGSDGSTGDAGGNIDVSTAGVSLSASGNSSQVQIGNGGSFMSGNASGAITLTDSGDLNVFADGTGAFAQIGNGDPLHMGSSNGSVGGDISLQVAGASTLGGIAGIPWVGNLADGTGVASGNVSWVSHALNGGPFSTLIVADLNGGDVTLGITDPTANSDITNGFVYNSPHNLTLLSAGEISIQSTIQNNGSGALTLVAGWNPKVAPANVATTAGAYGNNNQSITIGGAGGVGSVSFGSAGGTTTVLSYDVMIDGANGYAQLGYHGAGGGAIDLTITHDLSMTTSSGYAMIGNGSLDGDVSGNVGGDITIQVGGALHDNDSVGNPIFFGNATASGTETGNLVMVMSSEDGTSNDALGNSVRTDLAGGDVTLGFTGATAHGPSHNYVVNTPHTLNLLSAGDLVIAGSVQNTGTGAINLVGGWDGHTLAPASFGNAGVFGNNGGAVIIGGAHATSNVAIGSASGTTSVYAASLSLSAINGYVQLGFNGSGMGGILVTVSGGVTISGGANAGQFAQIGNGGLNTSGNNGGAINIAAGGDLTLTGGAGNDAYAQVGHGGDQSNLNGAGYSNVAAIAVSAANVMLDAGSGDASYVQIGNGGFKSGAGLTGGTATNGGDITVNSADAVTLLANGADAYAQIGNGGDQSNLNPAAAAGGVDSGDIVVHAPVGAAGAVMLTAGSGANAYAQIGNGGYSANAGANATAANFTMLGSISVTDLSLTGGDTSGNSYAQIGNGDAALASFGDASGDIVIAANGTITYHNGSAPHSPAVIGNFTGQGSTSGTVTGASPPPSTIVGNPGIVGVIVTLVSNPISNPANNPNNSLLNGPVTPLIETEVVPTAAETAAGAAGAGLTLTTQGPIASLSGESADTPSASDSATVVVADSLNGADKPSATKSLIGGILTQVTPSAAGQTIHGIPPADQDFSSWGNEAFWR